MLTNFVVDIKLVMCSPLIVGFLNIPVECALQVGLPFVPSQHFSSSSAYLYSFSFLLLEPSWCSYAYSPIENSSS